MRKVFGLIVLAFGVVHWAEPSAARVERIDVLARDVFADGRSFGKIGAYEKLSGILHIAVDPMAAANQAITDIQFAPVDARGLVTFQSEFVLLRPLDPTKANGRLLYDVTNRGYPVSFGAFNSAGRGEQAGNGFLFEQGYTVLYSAWNWDVQPGGGRLQITLPLAMEDGAPVAGPVIHEITLTSDSQDAPAKGMMAVGYPASERAKRSARLTVQDSWDAPRRNIDRSLWRFGRVVEGNVVDDPTWITLDGGFIPGKLYHLTYEASGSPVIGLGLVAVRDALSFFRFQQEDGFGRANPLLDNGGSLPDWSLAFGNSQSGRALTTMILDGLHVDEQNRMVIDGALIAMAGGGKGGFNIRFGQTSRHMSHQIELDIPTDWFPFSSMEQTDPVTGQTASLFDTARELNRIPKVMHVHSSTDYWGRSASLTHTTVDGSSDAGIDSNVRIYAIASGPHAALTSPTRGTLSQCGNPLDVRPILRAALIHMDAWASLGTPPPDSRYPTVSDGTLVDLDTYNEGFPSIAGARLPTGYLKPPRLDLGDRFASDGIMDRVPPRRGRPFETKIPASGPDGSDVAGLVLPAVSVPVGTYTGWNLQSPETGAADRLSRWIGSFIPFAATRADRIAAGDSRPSLEERYETRDAYVTAVAEATFNLAAEQWILGMDIDPIIKNAGAFFDRIAARDPADESCRYLTE